MKALTISQPFASLIANGEKWIENRVWRTEYTGLLAIHAGLGTQYMSKAEMAKEGYQTGCIIAVAKLVACVRLTEIRERDSDPNQRTQFIHGTNRLWCEASRHKHAEGPYCWILEDVKAIEPIKATGKQNLWYPTADTLAKIKASI